MYRRVGYRYVEEFLELSNLLADRRLCHHQFVSRLREAEVTRRSVEGAKQVQRWEACRPWYSAAKARNRQGSDVRALRTILATMESHLDRPLDYARLNTALHRRIAKLSTNAPLRSLYLTLLDFYETDVHSQQLPPVVASENIAVHQQLLDAIEAGGEVALDEAMRRHDEHRTSLGMFRPGAPIHLPDLR